MDFVAPKFHVIVQTLQSSRVMDRLRFEGLLCREEYSRLIEKYATDEERARKLINDILPRKGRDSFRKFCEVLLAIEGQEHIVNDIIQPPRQALERSEPRTRPPAQKKDVASIQPPRQALERSEARTRPHAQKKDVVSIQPSRQALERSEARTRPPAQKKYVTSHAVASKRAAFFFKWKHKSKVNRMRGIIRCMCNQLLGIRKQNVWILFSDCPGIYLQRKKRQLIAIKQYPYSFVCKTFSALHTAGMKRQVRGTTRREKNAMSKVSWYKSPRFGHQLYADVNSILIGIVVFGVEKARVKENCRLLTDTIAGFLHVPRRSIRIEEVCSTNSAVVMFRVNVRVLFPLLQFLGQQDVGTVKSRVLQCLWKVLPGVYKAVLRIGGLPPVTLLKGSKSQESIEGKVWCFYQILTFGRKTNT